MAENWKEYCGALRTKTLRLSLSIGRSCVAGTSGDISTLERELVEEFKRLSIPELTLPSTSEFEWLFLAQHYGDSNPSNGLVQ